MPDQTLPKVPLLVKPTFHIPCLQITHPNNLEGFPGSSASKESAYNAGDPGSTPGLGRSTGEGERLPTPVFWPGELHQLYSPWGCKELHTTERLSLSPSFKLWGSSLPP